MGARAFALNFGPEPIRREQIQEKWKPLSHPDLRRGKVAVTGQLRDAIARIEGRAPQLAVAGSPPSVTGVCPRVGLWPDPGDISPARREIGRGLLRFGIAEPDLALGDGLPVAALHEVRAAEAGEAASAIGFALLFAGLAAGFDRPVFWIAEEMAQAEAGSLYGPGLAALGLDPGLLVRVRVRKLAEALWAAGEVAAAGAGPCLMEIRGNPARADLAFTRRLALRARAAGLPVILLRQGGEAEASAAASRWAIAPADSRVSAHASRVGASGAGPSARWLGPPAFAVTLEKCRGGRPGRFFLEWNCHERRFVPIVAGTFTRMQSADGAAAGAYGEPFDGAFGKQPALSVA